MFRRLKQFADWTRINTSARKLGWLGLAFTAFAIASGCETTDYEPVIFKKKLRELEEQTAGDSAELRQKIEQLEREIAELKKTVTSSAPPNGADSSSQSATSARSPSTLSVEAESKIIDELKAAGAIVEIDDVTNRLVGVNFQDAQYDNDVLRKLIAVDSLTRLIINGAKTDAESFAIIGDMVNLEYLEAEQSPATVQALSELAGLKKLSFIQLFRSDISDDGFEQLAKLPNLQQIRCGQTRISDDALAHISNLQSLRALDLSDCNRISDLGLAHIEGLANLNFLKVWGPQITDRGMDAIAKLKALKVLGLNDTQVTDAGIAKLAGLRDLNEVHLVRTNIGDFSMQILSEMPAIISLNLRDTKISDEGLRLLSRLSNLKKLDLSETNAPGVTDLSGETLRGLTQLQELNLWSTRFSDEGVRQIAELPNLQWLNLDKTKISDASVAELQRLPNLQWLHLGSNQLTDGCIDSLLKIQKLKYLNVSFTEISEERFFDLYDQLSERGCEVVGP
jgi:Leucine-rich repeat (LRR) protein